MELFFYSFSLDKAESAWLAEPASSSASVSWKLDSFGELFPLTSFQVQHEVKFQWKY